MQISKYIQLGNKNIIQDSEIIILKEKRYVLKKGVDYNIDYKNGRVYFLLNSFIINKYKKDVEKYGLEIKYSYYLDFNKDELFNSENVIYNEEVKFIPPDKIILEKNIDSIIEIRNIEQKEKYVPISINKNEVIVSYNNKPNISDVNASASFYKYGFDDFFNFIIYFKLLENEYKNIYNVVSCNVYNEYVYLFNANELIILYTPLDVDIEIKLFNGGILNNNEYEINKTIINNYYDFVRNAIKISEKYKNNKVLISIKYKSNLEINNELLLFNISPVNEYIDFFSDNNLLFLQKAVKINVVNGVTNFIDKYPNIIVFDHINKIIYKNMEDYYIDYNNKKIIRLNTQMSEKVVVIYYDNLIVDNLTIKVLKDKIYADYVYYNNYIDWSKYRMRKTLYKDIDIYMDTQLISLVEYPINWKDIKIYLKNDYYKRNIVDIYKYDEYNNIIYIKTNTYGKAVIEYDYYDEPFKQNTTYYVTYKYGASYEKIKNYFLKIMDLFNLRKTIKENVYLKSGQNKYTLKNYPVDNNIKIYKENDKTKEPVTIINNIDKENNIIYFNEINETGNYIIEYFISGFDRKLLLNILNKLYAENDRNISIKNISNIISTISTDYTIESRDSIAYKIGDIINDKIQFNVRYAISSVDGVGALFLDGNYIKTSSKYISPIEGTIEFLFSGSLLQNDRRQYFIDIYNKISNNNRISLYRDSKNLYLDFICNNGKLIRKVKNIEGSYYTEKIYLNAGINKIKLSKEISKSIRDYDNNTTPDYYDSINGKIIIMPENTIFTNEKYKNTIKVLFVDILNNELTIERIEYSGFYYITYPVNIHDNFEALNFVAFSWKLHKNDNNEPFVNLYYNGIKVVNKTLSEIIDLNNLSQYDVSIYDKDRYSQ